MKKMMIMMLLCSGCSEQVLLGTMIGAQAWDYESTRRVLEAGGTERNPLVGSSNDNVLFFKIGFTGLLYLCGEIWPEHKEAFYLVGTISGVVCGIHNEGEHK
jgi:hypothetical protein